MSSAITIFTCPKPFSDRHISIIQHNAIQSWLRLEGIERIILVGDEQGVVEAAMEYGLVHISKVLKNSYGTPLVNGIFSEVIKQVETDYMIYVNTDIILFDDIVSALKKLKNDFGDFLAVGRRWNYDLCRSIDFSGNWQKSLREDVLKNGELFTPFAIDYFAYSRRAFPDKLPPFALGRFAWDGHLLGEAIERNIPVIDLTNSVMIVHQNHNYYHIKNGIQTAEVAICSEESKLNHTYTKYAGTRISSMPFLLANDVVIKREKQDFILHNLYVRLDQSGALLTNGHYLKYVFNKFGDFLYFCIGRNKLKKLCVTDPGRYERQLKDLEVLFKNHLRSMYTKFIYSLFKK